MQSFKAVGNWYSGARLRRWYGWLLLLCKNGSGSPVFDIHSGQFEIDAQLAQEVVVEIDVANTSS